MHFKKEYDEIEKKEISQIIERLKVFKQNNDYASLYVLHYLAGYGGPQENAPSLFEVPKGRNSKDLKNTGLSHKAFNRGLDNLISALLVEEDNKGNLFFHRNVFYAATVIDPVRNLDTHRRKRGLLYQLDIDESIPKGFGIELEQQKKWSR